MIEKLNSLESIDPKQIREAVEVKNGMYVPGNCIYARASTTTISYSYYSGFLIATHTSKKRKKEDLKKRLINAFKHTEVLMYVFPLDPKTNVYTHMYKPVLSFDWKIPTNSQPIEISCKNLEYQQTTVSHHNSKFYVLNIKGNYFFLPLKQFKVKYLVEAYLTFHDKRSSMRKLLWVNKTQFKALTTSTHSEDLLDQRKKLIKEPANIFKVKFYGIYVEKMLSTKSDIEEEEERKRVVLDLDSFFVWEKFRDYGISNEENKKLLIDFDLVRNKEGFSYFDIGSNQKQLGSIFSLSNIINSLTVYKEGKVYVEGDIKRRIPLTSMPTLINPSFYEEILEKQPLFNFASSSLEETVR